MAKAHIHSYIKWKKSKRSKEIWFKCADPHCTHIIPYSLVIGKATLCPQCKNVEFILNWQALRRTVPRCVNCRNTKESRTIKAAESLIKQATGILFEQEVEKAKELINQGILDITPVEEINDDNTNPADQSLL